MTAEELKAHTEELADQCIADIEKYWSFSPSLLLSHTLANSIFPDLDREKYDWRTTLKYHLARVIVQNMHTKPKEDNASS